MRKHKILAVLMMVVFVIASLSGVNVQADTIGKEAQACTKLGILLGADKSGVTSQYLSAIPTRLQAYIIALRLKGLYDEAGKYTSSISFTDASGAGWAKNYLAYAKNRPELGWSGYPDGRFGVNDKVNAQAFYKVMLETLGYKQNVDFTYAQTLGFAEKIGLLENGSEIAAIKSFTINDIAKGIYGALNTNVAGTDIKLVDRLVDKGIFKLEAVEAAGLNSSMQIAAMVDSEYQIAWVSVKDTFKKMGAYIVEDRKGSMYYQIRKGEVTVRLTEGVAAGYINDTKVTLEKPVMKGEDGIYYVPVSFVMASAGEFGYDAKYLKAGKILELEESAKIMGTQRDIVIAKGNKKIITVEKTYAGIKGGDVTNRCTFAVASNNGIVQLGSAAGELIGKNVGSAEIIISYEGKEVDRVIAHVVDMVPKYYTDSYYEQVFETIFNLDKPDFTDGFGTVWKKTAGIIAKVVEDDSVDTGSSLNILNYSENGSGITVDLSKLVEDRGIKGKTSTLIIYAKGISESPKLYVKVNSKSKYEIINKENTVVLDGKWKSIELIKIDIPQDAQELTLSIGIGKNDEIRIDAFKMILN
jgi:hypothetical protein